VGLITGLLTLPLAPVRGVAWVAEQVALEAEREADDATRARRELAQLEMELELGRIDEREYERREEGLLERIERAHGEGV
jgi:Gas vesicle protein G